MTKAILKDFPQEFFTERLWIRLPLPGDGEAVHEAKQASRQELKQWLEWAQYDEALEDTEANVREAHTAFLQRKDMRLHIFHRETKEFIGCTGLHEIDWEVPKFEIGYWLDTRQTGKGYTTEAVQGLTDFAFQTLGANRVEIRCDAKNEKSRAIPERLNYSLEGVLRNDSVQIGGNELRDTCVYAKVR